jgi:hypothetical protein
MVRSRSVRVPTRMLVLMRHDGNIDKNSHGKAIIFTA